MLQVFGSPGSFGFYAGLNVIALIMIFFLMPGQLLLLDVVSPYRVRLNHLLICLIVSYCRHSESPETKQRTLEELDYVFAVPTGRHAAYQGRQTLPYFIQRYIFWNKKAELKPLYDFTEVQSISGVPEKMAH